MGIRSNFNDNNIFGTIESMAVRSTGSASNPVALDVTFTADTFDNSFGYNGVPSNFRTQPRADSTIISNYLRLPALEPLDEIGSNVYLTVGTSGDVFTHTPFDHITPGTLPFAENATTLGNSSISQMDGEFITLVSTTNFNAANSTSLGVTGGANQLQVGDQITATNSTTQHLFNGATYVITAIPSDTELTISITLDGPAIAFDFIYPGTVFTFNRLGPDTVLVNGGLAVTGEVNGGANTSPTIFMEAGGTATAGGFQFRITDDATDTGTDGYITFIV